MLHPFLAIERWWLFDPNTLSSDTHCKRCRDYGCLRSVGPESARWLSPTRGRFGCLATYYIASDIASPYHHSCMSLIGPYLHDCRSLCIGVCGLASASVHCGLCSCESSGLSSAARRGAFRPPWRRFRCIPQAWPPACAFIIPDEIPEQLSAVRSPLALHLT
jgi:hypothetical protein